MEGERELERNKRKGRRERLEKNADVKYLYGLGALRVHDHVADCNLPYGIHGGCVCVGPSVRQCSMNPAICSYRRFALPAYIHKRAA